MPDPITPEKLAELRELAGSGFANDDGWQTIACWGLAVSSLYAGVIYERGGAK